MNNVRDILQYFRIRVWTFKNNNTQSLWDNLSEKDKELFFFDMSNLSWEYFLQAMCLGLRVYLVNDDIYTIPAARKKWQRYNKASSLFLIYIFIKYFLKYAYIIKK